MYVALSTDSELPETLYVGDDAPDNIKPDLPARCRECAAKLHSSRQDAMDSLVARPSTWEGEKCNAQLRQHNNTMERMIRKGLGNYGILSGSEVVSVRSASGASRTHRSVDACVVQLHGQRLVKSVLPAANPHGS